MAKEIRPVAPSLPPVTAIADPAARVFAAAVAEALRAIQSVEGAVRTLSQAAEGLATGAPVGGGGGAPAIARWLYSSEVYRHLSSAIERVDLATARAISAEAELRTAEIEALNASLADLAATPAYDPLESYAAGVLVRFEGGLYRALQATSGNAPTDPGYWEKVGDYGSLGEAVAAHAAQLTDHEARITHNSSGLSAEVTTRETLATQLRGAYTGANLSGLTSGLLYAERQARSSADASEVTARQALAAQLTGFSDPSGKILSQLTSGLLWEERQARVAADGAEVTARQALSAKFTGVDDPTSLTLATLASGLLYEERTARVTQDAALASSVTALTSRMASTEAGLTTEQNTRATNDSALAQAINTAWAFTGATQAVIQSGGVLQTNWTAAQANRWNQLDAEVFTAGGKTIRAALSEEAQVRANADGTLFGQYTVKVDLNGWVTGYGFASTVNNGTPHAEFVVLANRFAVVAPGGAPLAPFVVDGLVTHINAAVIKDGSITNAKIGNVIESGNYLAGISGWRINKNGTAEFRDILARGNIEATSLKTDSANIVKTLHLDGEAVTVPRSASASNLTQSNGDVLSLAVPNGIPRVLISGFALCNITMMGGYEGDSFGAGSATVYLFKNGVQVLAVPVIFSGVMYSTVQPCVPFSYEDATQVGGTFSLRVAGPVSTRHLLCLGVKR